MRTYSNAPATRENVAYKLPEIEFAPKKGEVLPEPERRRRAAPAPQKRIRFSRILVMLAFAAVLVGVVANYMILNELSVGTSRLRSGIAKLQKEESALNAVLDKRMTLDEIEEYAVTRLGMVKQSKSSVEYINLSKGDKTTVVSGGRSASGFFTAVSALAGRLSATIGVSE